MAKRRYGLIRQAHDHRDLFFVPRMGAKTLLRKIDLQHMLPPVMDQGATNTCGPHAAKCCILADQMIQKASVDEPSIGSIYWGARVEMKTWPEDSGVDNRSMLRSLNRNGYAPEGDWPFENEIDNREPSIRAYKDMAVRTIHEYGAVQQTLWSYMATLCSGRPFILGFRVYPSFETEEVDQTGDVPMPHAGEEPVGGHDIVVYGYDVDTQEFKFRNSYGSEWGRSGNGLLPFAYVVNPSLAGDAWVIRAVPDPGVPLVGRLPRGLTERTALEPVC